MCVTYRTEERHTGQSVVLGVRVGETLAAQMGLGHGRCITKGNVLVNRASKPIPALLCMLCKQLLSYLAPSPKHTDPADRLDQSKPITWQSKGPSLSAGAHQPLTT